VSGPLRAPKGVPDFVPPDGDRLRHVRETLTAGLRCSGYGYVELPVFEETELFVRGVGESTDIVAKEMFSFRDRGDRDLTLRPEGTAGALRALLEHGLDRRGLPVKLWYAGPMFRAERPQLGRYRQFQQVGAEAVGSEDPALDAELVWLAVEGFRSLGLQQVTLLLNSLGDSDSRDLYRARLVAFLERLDLDEDTRRRVRVNPLRVLDDKRVAVQEQLADAPELPASLNDATRAHHDAVRQHLTDLGVAWVDAPRLVRGLDYYTRTTFELEHRGLGAQSAIGGGGRYDGLSELVGGPRLPGVGWALGLERTLLALDAEGITLPIPAAVQVFCIPIGGEARARVVPLVAALRRAGVATDMAYDSRGLKGAMKAADRSGGALTVVLGERDLADGVAQVKEMASGEQVAVPLDELVSTIAQRLGALPPAWASAGSLSG